MPQKITPLNAKEVEILQRVNPGRLGYINKGNEDLIEIARKDDIKEAAKEADIKQIVKTMGVDRSAAEAAYIMADCTDSFVKDGSQRKTPDALEADMQVARVLYHAQKAYAQVLKHPPKSTWTMVGGTSAKTQAEEAAKNSMDFDQAWLHGKGIQLAPVDFNQAMEIALHRTILPRPNCAAK